MSTSTLRTPTSFRLQTALLEELKAKAKENNRSLNNYVEYLLMNVLHPSKETEENAITPELQAKINKARQEYKEGKTLHFENKDDMNAWLDSL